MKVYVNSLNSFDDYLQDKYNNNNSDLIFKNYMKIIQLENKISGCYMQ